jgi:hypothetical protein
MIDIDKRTIFLSEQRANQIAEKAQATNRDDVKTGMKIRQGGMDIKPVTFDANKGLDGLLTRNIG